MYSKVSGDIIHQEILIQMREISKIKNKMQLILQNVSFETHIDTIEFKNSENVESSIIELLDTVKYEILQNATDME